MIAGLLLSDNKGKDCHLAFLGESCETFSVETNNEILEKLAEFQPEVLAVDSGSKQNMDRLTESEQELKDEGYSFTPTSHEIKKVKRLQSLEAGITREVGEPVETIRFDPQITSGELAVEDDSGLNSMGVDASCIENAKQFDAVLGAVTARFYQQDQYRDLGIIIPEKLED